MKLKILLVFILLISLAQGASNDNVEEWSNTEIQPNHIITLSNGDAIAYDVSLGVIYLIDSDDGSYIENDISDGAMYAYLSTFEGTYSEITEEWIYANETFVSDSTIFASNMVLTNDESQVIISTHKYIFCYDTATLEEEWCIPTYTGDMSIGSGFETEYVSPLLIDADECLYYTIAQGSGDDSYLIKVDISDIPATPADQYNFTTFTYFTDSDGWGLASYPMLIPDQDQLIFLNKVEQDPDVSNTNIGVNFTILNSETMSSEFVQEINLNSYAIHNHFNELPLEDMSDIYIDMFDTEPLYQLTRTTPVNYFITGGFNDITANTDSTSYDYEYSDEVVMIEITAYEWQDGNTFYEMGGTAYPIRYTESITDYPDGDGFAFNRGETSFNASGNLIAPFNSHGIFGSADFSTAPSIFIYNNDTLVTTVNIVGYFDQIYEDGIDMSFLLVGAPIIDTNDFGYIYTIDINDEDTELDTNGDLSGLLCFDTRNGGVVWFAPNIEPNCMFFPSTPESTPEETYLNARPSGSSSFSMNDDSILICCTDGVYKFDIIGEPLYDTSEAKSGEYALTPIIYQYSSSTYSTGVVDDVINFIGGSSSGSSKKTASVISDKTNITSEIVETSTNWLLWLLILAIIIYMSRNKIKSYLKPKKVRKTRK